MQRHTRTLCAAIKRERVDVTRCVAQCREERLRVRVGGSIDWRRPKRRDLTLFTTRTVLRIWRERGERRGEQVRCFSSIADTGRRSLSLSTSKTLLCVDRDYTLRPARRRRSGITIQRSTSVSHPFSASLEMWDRACPVRFRLCVVCVCVCVARCALPHTKTKPKTAPVFPSSFCCCPRLIFATRRYTSYRVLIERRRKRRKSTSSLTRRPLRSGWFGRRARNKPSMRQVGSSAC